jgi:hypothetical protein
MQSRYYALIDASPRRIKSGYAEAGNALRHVFTPVEIPQQQD